VILASGTVGWKMTASGRASCVLLHVLMATCCATSCLHPSMMNSALVCSGGGCLQLHHWSKGDRGTMTHGVPCLKRWIFENTRARVDPIDAIEAPHSCHHFLRGRWFRRAVFQIWRPSEVGAQRFSGKSCFSMPHKFPRCRRVCLKIPGFKILFDSLIYCDEFYVPNPTSCLEVMKQRRLKVFLSFGVPCLTF